MAALVVLIAVVTVLQVFVSYCRSLLATYSAVKLSEQGRELTGIGKDSGDASDFKRLVQLARLCPEPKGDRVGVQAVGAYYRTLDLLHAAFRRHGPRVVKWTERERARCAYFAAVVLDRRIAYSRALWAEQMNDSS